MLGVSNTNVIWQDVIYTLKASDNIIFSFKWKKHRYDESYILKAYKIR